MDKKAQFDDYNEYNDPDPVSDRENWEEDQQAEAEYDEDELTNTNEPPMSQEQLAAMHSRELGVAILTWHGGQNSPLYSLGSTLAAGKEITSEMAINGIRELKSLLGGTADAPQLTPGDRIEIENLMGEIDNRFLAPEREERRLDAQTQESLQEEQMFPTVEDGSEDAFGSSEKISVYASWVRGNCKFASLMDVFSREELNVLIGHPDRFLEMFKNKYQQMASKFSDYSQKDIELALKQLDAAVFPGQGDVLATPSNMRGVMDLLQIQIPQVRQQAPQGKKFMSYEEWLATKRNPKVPG